jgi:C4-dicarboxylate transporter DctM subunit
MVIYGVTVGASIGELLLAGAVPGLVVGVFQLVLASWVAKRRGYPKGEMPSLKRIARSVFNNAIALIMPIVVLGGIVTGFVTPTEAAAIAVLYSLVVGFCVFQELRLRDLPGVLLTTGLSTGVVLIIVSAASAFSWILAAEQVPQDVTTLLTNLTVSPLMTLLLINALLLVVGCFLDITPAIIILAPILFPLASKLGVGPVQFGTIMVVNLGVGLCTPPVGNCLYVVSHLSNLSMVRVFIVAIPFLAANLVTLLLVTYVPWLSTFLPALLMH